MRDEKKFRITTLLILLIVLAIFASLFVYAGIRTRRAHAQVEEHLSARESERPTISPELLGENGEDYALLDVSGLIYDESQIDVALEDNALREVEYEHTYINTTELLPSVWQKRMEVPARQVSDDNFPLAAIGGDLQEVQVKTAVIRYPSEVHLYRANSEKSGTASIVLEMDDPDGILGTVGWISGNPGTIRFSQDVGTSNTIELLEDKKSGSFPASFIVEYEEEPGLRRSMEIPIAVHVDKIEGKDVRLYDQDGFGLYLDADGKKEAHLSDYSAKRVFYGPIRTMGWQTIEGNTFYFDRLGVPVTGNQIIGGMLYSFDEEGILLSAASGFTPGELTWGIDVSMWQKEIDWDKVASSGVSFAIIRCGFRGSASGKLVEDPTFRQNIEGAKRAGIKVGVYFFTQALDEKEAREEASMAVALCRQYDLDLPIYVDSENASNGRANGLGKEQRTKCLVTFCETVSRAGYSAGVYASKNWYYNKVDASQLEKYSIWVAQYNTEFTYTGKADFWQYSSREHIEGIEGYVDMDVILK